MVAYTIPLSLLKKVSYCPGRLVNIHEMISKGDGFSVAGEMHNDSYEDVTSASESFQIRWLKTGKARLATADKAVLPDGWCGHSEEIGGHADQRRG